MELYREVNRLTNKITEYKRAEEREIRDRYRNMLARELDKLLPYKVGDILKFNCDGSGYHGIYLGCIGRFIRMLRTNKQGKSYKEYEYDNLLSFSIYDIDRIEQTGKVADMEDIALTIKSLENYLEANKDQPHLYGAKGLLTRLKQIISKGQGE